MPTDLEKIHGCLAGLAVGDAMGRPTELLFNYKRIEKKLGRVTGLVGRARGEVTDDTRLSLTVADAIIDKGGMVTADELVDSWSRRPEFAWRRFARSFDRSQGFWFGEHVVAFAGRHGVPGRYTGYLNASWMFVGNEAAMIMAPVGIVFRGRPDEAARAGRQMSRACIVGTASDIAGAWAAGIAAALMPGATVETVVEVVRANAPARVLGYFDKALHIASRYDDVFEVRRALYESCLRLIQVDARETVPVALAMFVIARGDPMTAVIGGANFGRDSDTIAGMAGLLAGALSGVGRLDKQIYEAVLDANGFDMADYASRLEAIEA
jgi:ADP-ribosylglycohydrolase